MKTDNGSLSFEADINNEKLVQSVDEMEKRIQGFSKKTVQEGQKVDDVFRVTAENIRIQKDVIAQLENNLNNLNIEISKLPKGSIGQVEMKKQAAQLTAELNAEKSALRQLEAEVGRNEQKQVSFRTQLRLAREELIAMEQAGKRGTQAYAELQQKVGELTDAYDDATQQARVLANDEKGFQGVVSMVSGFTGAMSAAQGAVGLFAGENENLNKIMLRVQSLMGITIGLQQVAETLNKDSYFSIVILGKAKEMLAVAEVKVATAMGITTAAARVLMATLTLGLSVAITAIIVLMSKLASKSSEAKKKQEEFNKAVVDAAVEPIAALQSLVTKWNQLGNNMDAKRKLFEDSASDIEKMGIAIKDVNEAEAVLTDPATLKKLQDAFIARAKSMAAVDMASEKYKEVLAKQLEMEQEGKTKTKTTNWGYGTETQTEVENEKYTKLDKERAELQAEADNLIKMSVEFTATEKSVLESIGVASNQVVEGSIQALQDSIARLEEKYKDAATSKERESLLKEIKKQKALLDKIDKSGSESGKQEDDPVKKELDRKKNLYSQYFKWVNSNDPILQQAAKTEFAGILKEGASYIDYLQRQRDQIMSNGDTTADLKGRLQAINNEIADETSRTFLQDFEQSLNIQIDKAGTALEVLKLIKAEKDKLSGDNSDLDNAKKDFLEEAERKAKEKSEQDTDQRKQEYDQLVADYGDYERRKQAIIDQYEKKRKVAGADQAVLDNLTKEQEAAIKQLQEEFIRTAGLQDLLVGDGSEYLVAKIKAVFPLFTELADATKSELQKIKKVIDGIEVTPDQKALLLTLGLTEKQVDELIKKLEKLKKEGATAANEQSWKSVLEDVSKLSSAIDGLGGVLSQYGGFVGELGEGLQGLSGSFDDIYTAFTSTDPMAVVSAGINGVIGLVSLVTNQIMENRKAQEDWNAKIEESAHLMKMARLESMDFQDSNLFGINNPYAAAIAGMEQYAEAMKMLSESSSSLEGGQVQVGSKKAFDGGNVMSGVGLGAAAGAAVGSVIPAVGTLIGGAVGAFVGGIVGLFSRKTVPVFESLKQKYGEIYDSETFELNPQILADYGKLDDATKQLVDNWQEIKDKAIEAQEQIEETIQSLAGEMGSSLSDSLKDAFRDGDIYNAVDEYHDYVTGVIEDIISQLVFNQVFGGMFDKLSKDMKASFDVGGDQSIVDDIAKFNETYKAGLEAYNEAMTEAQKQMEQDGIEIFKKKADESMKGAIQGASEEKISMLSGYANAIRINQIEGIRIMRDHLIALHAIATNTAVLHEMLSIMRSGDNTLRSQGL